MFSLQQEYYDSALLLFTVFAMEGGGKYYSKYMHSFM